MRKPPARIFIALSLLVSLFGSLGTAPLVSAQWQTKVDPQLLSSAAQGEMEFLVFLKDQADLSGAAQLKTRLEKGRYVYDRLTATAQRSQGPVIAALAALGAAYRPYWVANIIWVRGDQRVLQALAQRSDVSHLYENPAVHLDPLPEPAQTFAPAAPEAIEWNISKVNAPQVWSAGFTGQGVVIGGQDTGYLWDHAALKDKYRGWDGSSADHNYNWHDAIHSGGGSCGANSPQPCDDYGHGTHTMGTMVGDDGQGNQIGMAPGAKWIGCRNMDQGTGSPATYTECFQWFLAPTNLSDQNADPAKAPDIINNSWGCPPQEGCSWDSLQTVIANVRAAGILVVVSAGNGGSSCNLVTDPPAVYAASFTVGATDPNDAIASFSSRGPALNTGLLTPDVTAPGTPIRSSTRYSTTSYGLMQGTSMAAPHVAGLAALLISAQPSLAGQPALLESLITRTSVPLTTAQTCGARSSAEARRSGVRWGRAGSSSSRTERCSVIVDSAASTRHPRASRRR
ncbi:MAG TPA: S8 family serine peptidase, partial [Anaerolineales bacterium]